MKLRKIIAASALAAVTAAAVSVTSSAALVVVEGGDSGLSTGTGNWMVQLYNVGNEAENKPATDYGINYADIAKLSVVMKATDPDWMDGNPGGSIIWSQNGGDIGLEGDLFNKYNWPSNEYWGVNDPDLEFTADDSKPVVGEKVGDYTYEWTLDVSGMNALANGDAASIGCMQAGIQYWGSDMSDFEVVSFTAFDKNGEALLKFDGKGTLTYSAAVAPSPNAAEEEAAPVEEAAPAEETAPAEEAAPTLIAPAPATGDVQAATTSSKGSPDTGIADVAAVAGVAIVAGGALLVAKKRK